jgi:hypothetical protein
MSSNDPLRTSGQIGKRIAMRVWHVLLTMSLFASPGIGWAETRRAHPVPQQRQLSGLSVDEATGLLAKLADAQRALKDGRFQPFQLMAGSIASYPETKVSPREAFLQLPFEKAWKIERGPRHNPLWQPYKLAYAPNGLGQLFWDIEVVLGFTGDIERVLMIYRPPAPF